MERKTQKELIGSTCKLPRRSKAIEALFGLAWKKEKKDRPKWLIQELSSYCY